MSVTLEAATLPILGQFMMVALGATKEVEDAKPDAVGDYEDSVLVRSIREQCKIPGRSGSGLSRLDSVLIGLFLGLA